MRKETKKYKLSDGTEVANTLGDNCPGKFAVLKIYDDPNSKIGYIRVIYLLEDDLLLTDLGLSESTGKILVAGSNKLINNKDNKYKLVGKDMDGFSIAVNFQSENSEYVRKFENELKEIAKEVMAELLLY